MIWQISDFLHDEGARKIQIQIIGQFIDSH